MAIRKSAFAGSWYPRRADACEQEIQEYIDAGPAPAKGATPWVGGIVPHAGWYYSGRIACNVIHELKEVSTPDLVVVFGMHLHLNSPNYMMPRGAWETPFGPLDVAEELAEHLMERFAFELETTERFVQDNTVELQMPFIKYLLAPKQVLAIGVPPATASLDIGRAVVDWARQNDKELKIIGSTDLTHYGSNYGFSPHGSGEAALQWVRDTNDRRVIDALLDLAPEKVIEEGIQHQNACCSGAAATAVAAAVHMDAKQARMVDYATSYEKSPGESFVGYVGLVFG